MNDSVAAVPDNVSQADKPQPRPTAAGPPASAGARFTYPSGSRPLEGFTIKRGVGHGGFGEVYFATSDAGKEVALKLIRRNLDVELRGIRQCLNLKHPNLLSIFDIREDQDGDKWVVMEYVAGDCLEDLVAANPHGLPADHVLFWMHGIGAGVAYLHDHGIVHRDLKPGNIFNDEGIVKIGDYGLSKFISCSRRSGQTESIGTVHYMAPEVANGRYGKEIDVYALGVILYELLTGRVPFEGESVGEVLMKHLTAKPDVSMLPQPYRGVVAKALDKDPAQRYASAGEMLAALPRPPEAARLGPIPVAAAAGVKGRKPRPAGPPPARPFSSAATAGEEEPIFRALRQTVHDLRQSWNRSNLNTPAKVVILILVILALQASAGILVPLAIFFLALYGCYWVVRGLILTIKEPVGPRPSPVAAGAVKEPPADTVPPRSDRSIRRPRTRLPRWARREKALDALILKSPRERATELLGSMLGGAFAAATVCLVMVVLGNLAHDRTLSVDDAARYGWVLLMSIVGAWAVMIPSKFWEGSRGDVRLRRFAMLVVGLAVGLFAAAASAAMLVDLPHMRDLLDLNLKDLTGLEPVRLTAQTVLADVRYYLVAFGSLFLLLRWWRQADPLRTTRLSLWAVFVCGVFALIISSASGFPQPWLVMVACAMSVSVQLASPWIHPRLRGDEEG